MAERIKLGGLWLNKTRDGKEYLSGNLNGNVKILIFKNDYRTADNQPTHVMYLAPIEKEPEGPRPGAAPADGFFGVGALPAGEEGGEDYGDFSEADEAPTPAPARSGPSRPAAPQQRPAAAPARPAPGAGGGRPAPQQRRPAPAANGDSGGGGGFDDFEDPFAE